jgi:hypothetical protein
MCVELFGPSLGLSFLFSWNFGKLDDLEKKLRCFSVSSLPFRFLQDVVFVFVGIEA